MNRALVLAAVFAIFSATSDAAPIPLIEFSYETTNFQIGAVPTSVPFWFRAYEPDILPTPVYVSWSDNYSPAVVGMGFFAPSEIVTGANAALRSATAIYDMRNGTTNHSGSATLAQLPIGTTQLVCQGLPCKKPLVSDVTAYTVTAVERVINHLELTALSSDNYLLESKQTIRYWGTSIPERT